MRYALFALLLALWTLVPGPASQAQSASPRRPLDLPPPGLADRVTEEDALEFVMFFDQAVEGDHFV